MDESVTNPLALAADEAHRSQYDFLDGFALHMRDALPHASFVGFTGTPIEQTDANTRAVFGDYISVYDIQRAVFDGATLPIYNESRLAKLELSESERPKIDPEFEEATEGEEVERKEKLKSVQARSFAELLEQAVRKYQNRAIETAQVIEELIQLAKEMRAAGARGEQLGLSEDELAFYDALETNDSAVKVLGDDTLRLIARELVETVRRNVTIDWTLRENVRAQLRVLVKRILRRHGYPPDKQEKATQTVLEQAEVLSEIWAGA
jgi:type I restriction enzyme R subunit